MVDEGRLEGNRKRQEKNGMQEMTEEEVRITRCVRGLKHPICLSSVGNEMSVPFDLEVSWGFLEEGRARERVDVEFGFGRHLVDRGDFFFFCVGNG